MTEGTSVTADVAVTFEEDTTPVRPTWLLAPHETLTATKYADLVAATSKAVEEELEAYQALVFAFDPDAKIATTRMLDLSMVDLYTRNLTEEFVQLLAVNTTPSSDDAAKDLEIELVGLRYYILLDWETGLVFGSYAL